MISISLVSESKNIVSVAKKHVVEQDRQLVEKNDSEKQNDTQIKAKEKALQQANLTDNNISNICDASTVLTGKKYNVIGSSINVRKGPGALYERIVNQRATDTLGSTQYISIDDSVTVYEECTKNGWSWVRVIDPDGLQDTHKGWIASKFIDKRQNIVGDKYERNISSSALSPYTKQNYPKTNAKYGSRMSEIEFFRRKAAELAIDSGKCDNVLTSELSDNKSSLKHLYFWVECENKQRIYFDEFELKKGSQVLTEEEKSWDQASAFAACENAIKKRALSIGEVNIHTILGTSFNKAPITQKVVVRMDFDVKNAFGIEIAYTAICYFAPGEEGKIEIHLKNKGAP